MLVKSERRRAAPRPAVKTVNLALQGGGAHGAFAWGVLDRLIEDGRIRFEGISATSAGAMNAAVLAQGWTAGGPEGARAALQAFWRDIAETGERCSPYRAMPWMRWMQSFGGFSLEHSPAYQWMEFLTRMFSPYQLNPLNFNPLRQVLERHVDFERLRQHSAVKLFLCATNVQTCKVRIFSCADVSADAVLASACLPFMFQAVEIDGEPYWDGGYMGNPALFPLIYDCAARDVVIVHLNPIVRPGVPRTAGEILNRLNEVSFNSSLMREMRAIVFVTGLIEQGQLSSREFKQMLIHSIRADEVMSGYDASSKLNCDWDFLTELRDAGRAHAGQWLQQHFDALGVRSSVDLRAEFL
ncbi:patatin-like phospholipase family protein [Azohydromonas lata]|uniref:patatin-like phospholipase family protein n=1 Tax=Azohydromonas lata TaxID=45677 RepID=UPI00082E4C3E|nr:patatin-like phospholipase family protein [Azohydromonas lata]